MQIGNDTESLSISRVNQADPDSSFTIEALAIGFGCKFSAAHDGIMFDRSELLMQQLAEFEALRLNRLEIRLTEGGWLQLARDARGLITVRYRIAKVSIGAAMEGRVDVDAEFSSCFCRDLVALLTR